MIAVPALIVPVLTRPELLYRMVETLDYPIEQLVVIDNGAVVDLALVEERAQGVADETFVVKVPANLGVAGSWNLGIKVTPFASWWLICNFDVTWPAGALAEFARLAARPDALTLSGGTPPWCAFGIGEGVIRTVGLFDESFHPAYHEDDDYRHRCEQAGVPLVNSGVQVQHRNSSTLSAGYHIRNAVTFDENAAYYRDKVARGDLTAGRWDLDRRRELTWD